VLPAFNALPTQPDLEQIEEYLAHLKKKGASETDFKLTIYALRFLFPEGPDDTAIKLPSIKRDKALTTALSSQEMKTLLKVPAFLKHRVLLGVLYGCVLRCQEVRSPLISDVDLAV
jgi:site-specific recombinase XerD